ncbi:MAG: hypothetical protein QOI16_4594, partial [Pseudonocardiales bacterium]|nr:hypothetical protein [Pseudonocardiales bacterium]
MAMTRPRDAVTLLNELAESHL